MELVIHEEWSCKSVFCKSFLVQKKPQVDAPLAGELPFGEVFQAHLKSPFSENSSSFWVCQVAAVGRQFPPLERTASDSWNCLEARIVEMLGRAGRPRFVNVCLYV